ncbi:MAG: DNA repair protein RecO [Gammaproteobacteria bacterium]|nr:MAG: DNA repair protein RecO [Gammaproteobacteria bacterium]
MHIELQPAYVLHTRPYRDTSMLVDFITPEFGRLTTVARGVRSRKNSKRNLLNPFNRLLISFQGKTDLKLLTHFEAEGAHFSLSAKYLFSGFYLNELLVRLLPELDSHVNTYFLYEKSLQALTEQKDLEPILRHFELELLSELGYGIDFTCDSKTGESVATDSTYCLDTQAGFYLAPAEAAFNTRFPGQHICCIAQRELSDTDVKLTAKRITRNLLKPLLGNKPLMSRELFN